MASEQLIRELMSALKEEYGKEVSFDEASRILADLVGYFDTLAKIKHRDITGTIKEKHA